MAVYTYDQFEQEARKAGLLEQFSQADLNLAQQNADAGMSILKYKQDYQNATTDEARYLANMGAEQIRSSYGNYTGGGDGGSFNLNSVSPGSFQEAQAPEYTSRYDEQQQKLIDSIVNQEAFSYDPAADPSAQAYQKQYAREGQRATQDTMAAAAAATGGVPSSYAVTAASQAGDYYAAQMADKLPELYQQAYERYLTEYQQKLTELGMLQDAEQLDYSKFQDQLSQYNTDRSFRYGQLLDEIDSQTLSREEELEKAVLAAEYGDNSYLQGLGVDTSNDPTAYERQYNLALLKAEYGDYSGLRELGVDTSAMEAQSGASYTSSGETETEAEQEGDGGGTTGEGEVDPISGVAYETIDRILMAYPSATIPQSELQSVLAQYGVTAQQLTAAGFSVQTGAEAKAGNTYSALR